METSSKRAKNLPAAVNSIKIHMYWSIKNCRDTLRQLIVIQGITIVSYVTVFWKTNLLVRKLMNDPNGKAE